MEEAREPAGAGQRRPAQVGAAGSAVLQGHQKALGFALRPSRPHGCRGTRETPSYSEEVNGDLCSAPFIDLVDLEVSQGTFRFIHNGRRLESGPSGPVHFSSQMAGLATQEST